MIQDKIDKILLDFSKKVNKAILKGEFKRIKEDEHTVKIECLGETVEMWNTNTPKDTYCYRLVKCSNKALAVSLLFPDHEFKQPEKCRKILRTETEQEKAKRLEEVKEEIDRLKKQLEE